MTLAKPYGLSQKSAFNKEIDFDTDTIKAMLTTSSYVPNQATHQYKSSVTNEITGTGYTAGGVTLASKTVTYNTTLNALILDSADPSWATATFTCRYLVFYVDTGTSSTSALLSYVDFETNQSPVAQTFTYVLPSTGLYQITMG